MPQVHLSPGEQAWSRYLAIYQATDRVSPLTSRKKDTKFNVSIAMELLRDALILQYGQSSQTPPQQWLVKLKQDKTLDLQLTSIDEMLHASIFKWSEAIDEIPAQRIGDDSWVEGIPGRVAGYYPHPSLYTLLGENAYREILIEDATFETTSGIYQRINKAVQKELHRYSAFVSEDSIVHQKVTSIELAMRHLWRGIQVQHDLNAPAGSHIRLYSSDTMLDAHFKRSATEMGMSVREALNLSRWNPFSIFGIKPALWGKTTSLINVEEQLQKSVSKEPIKR